MNALKGDKFAVVLNEKENSLVSGTLDYFHDALLDYHGFTFVATIKHDKDTQPNGEPKRVHLHAYIEVENPTTKGAFIKELAELLKCDKEQISVSVSNNRELPVQYLTHKNQSEKTPYPYELIDTNNAELLEQLYNAVYVDPKQREKDLLNALRSSSSLYDIAEQYGLSEANRYKGLYQIFQRERGEEGLQDRYKLIFASYQKARSLLDEYDQVLLFIENDLRGIKQTELLKRVYSMHEELLKEAQTLEEIPIPSKDIDE